MTQESLGETKSALIVIESDAESRASWIKVILNGRVNVCSAGLMVARTWNTSQLHAVEMASESVHWWIGERRRLFFHREGYYLWGSACMIDGRNLNFSVQRILRWPLLVEMIAKARWSSERAQSRYKTLLAEKWEGVCHRENAVFLWKRLTAVRRWQAVAIRSAEFWSVCNLLIAVRETFRNKVGAAYRMIDSMSAL